MAAVHIRFLHICISVVMLLASGACACCQRAVFDVIVAAPKAASFFCSQPVPQPSLGTLGATHTFFLYIVI